MLIFVPFHSLLCQDIQLCVKFSMSVAEKLLPHFVQIPTEDDLKEITEESESSWGFPQVQLGQLMVLTFRLQLRPTYNQSDYYNRKGFHSIILQAVVDYHYMFIDICVVWPGSVHGARVLCNSSFYEKASNGTLFPNWNRRIS